MQSKMAQVERVKRQVSEKARSVVDSVSEKLTSTGRAISESAIERNKEAITGVLDRSIAALEKARKKLK